MDADNDKQPAPEDRAAPRTEGVRIIGADEAAAALQAGQAEGRRPEDAPRFGDVPEPPSASEPPAARFPLPNAVDPSQIRRVPLAGAPEMPHWTEPATGEVPAVLASASGESRSSSEEDDLAAWSGFAGGGARWRDHPRDWDDGGFDAAFEPPESSEVDALGALEVSEAEDYEDFDFDTPGQVVHAGSDTTAAAGAPARRRRGWTGPRSRGGRERPAGKPAPTRTSPEWLAEDPEDFDAVPAARRPDGGLPATGGGGRPAALASRLASGIGIAAVVLLVAQAGPLALLVLCTIATLLASAEGFGALRRAHYRPATLLGLAASVSLMLGAYYKGETALPLVATLATVFALLWYLAGVVRARPMANVGATLGMFMWAGFLASYAGLLLDPDAFPHRHGVAFLMAAVIAAVGYDVGGFVFGRRLGRHPLAAVSPNKTWEGLIGGMLTCLVATAAVVGQISPWDFKRAIALGLVAAVVAPLGDLCQSMIKRDLGLKDMGSILPGHGGLLDRVDSLLFVLPATYYLVRVLGIG